MKMQEILGLEAKHRIQMEDRLSGAQEEARLLRLELEEVRNQKTQLESSRAAFAIQLGANDEDQVPLDQLLKFHLDALKDRLKVAVRTNEYLTCVASQAYSWLLKQIIDDAEGAIHHFGLVSRRKVGFETVLGGYTELDEQDCHLKTATYNAAFPTNAQDLEWGPLSTRNTGTAVDTNLHSDGWWK